MRRILRILTVVFVLTGCGYFAPPPVSVGPCVLVVLARPSYQRLQPPYRVRQQKFIPQGANDPEADITFRGTGWQKVHMTLADPAGLLRMDEEVPGDDINDSGMGTSFDTPGLWRERLEDDNAGCTQEFSVEVLAPRG